MIEVGGPELNRNPDNYFAEAMQGAPEEIIRRQLLHFHRVDPQYARSVPHAPYILPKSHALDEIRPTG